MNLRIEEDLCIGCGSCEMVCPKNFEMRDDGIAHVIGEVDKITEDIEEAVDICPTAAIKYD